jgi:hypothetical protein
MTNKNKTTWDIVNKETHRKAHSSNIQHLNTDGITIDNPQLIAETFNNRFTSVAENVRTTNSNTYVQNTNDPDATDNNTYPENVEEMNQFRYATFQSTPPTIEIEHMLKTHKPKNSYGYDGISTKLLKITASVISSPLNYTSNKVLTKGIFPDRFKYSTIKPLN